MNEPPNNERLLADILAEGRDAGRRERLLGETLRLARRQRRFRQAGRGVSAVALAVACVWLFWRQHPPQPLGQVGSRPYLLVSTQPLPRAALVETKPLSAERMVSSAQNAEFVTTVAAGQMVREINDDDLLALAAPNAAVLVRLGPHSAELVFAHPTGESWQ